MSRGFSLLELVAVMVIAGIIAVLAIPYFADSGTQATWFADEVKAAMRYAQRQAVAQRRCVFVHVTSSQVSLFYGDTSCVITGTQLTFLATSVPGKSPGDAYAIGAPSGATISNNLGALPLDFSFNGLGQPSTAVSLSVGGRSIIVATETGYVQ